MALDIGSGISPVSPIEEKTLFMDLSREGIEFLKKKGFNAKIGSITKIPEEDYLFDVIFCSEVLEHIKDYKKALSEMKRVLKKNGKAIITVPVYMKYWNEDDEFVEHYRRFEPRELKEDLEKIGFRIKDYVPIGNFFDRYMTLMSVKIFKKSESEKMGKIKGEIIIFGNKILYFIDRIFTKFNSEKNTNIMLYVCEKV